MAAVVDRGAVHQDEVLVHPAAAYAETCRALAGRLHAGHHLDNADDVRFAHQGREALDQGGIHALHAHLGKDQVLALGPGEDGGGLELLAGGLELEVLPDGAAQIEADDRVFKTEIRAGHGMLSGGHAQRIEPRPVGDGRRLAVLQEHHRLHQRLPALRLQHIAGQHGPAALRVPGQGRTKQQDSQQDRRTE